MADKSIEGKEKEKEKVEVCGFKKCPMLFLESMVYVETMDKLRERMAYWEKKTGKDIFYSYAQNSLFHLNEDL